MRRIRSDLRARGFMHCVGPGPRIRRDGLRAGSESSSTDCVVPQRNRDRLERGLTDSGPGGNERLNGQAPKTIGRRKRRLCLRDIATSWPCAYHGGEVCHDSAGAEQHTTPQRRVGRSCYENVQRARTQLAIDVCSGSGVRGCRSPIGSGWDLAVVALSIPNPALEICRPGWRQHRSTSAGLQRRNARPR